MNRAVYKHILGTYGRRLGYWCGVTTELIRSLCLRVLSAVFMAQAVAKVAGGDIPAAKRNILYFLVLFCVGIIAGSIGDLVAFSSENNQYRRLLLDFYSKLVGKDMSFYRDNQTGYLASAFRQYLDAAIVLVRFFRANVLSTLITLLAPVAVLMFANWRVGLIALMIVLVQQNGSSGKKGKHGLLVDAQHHDLA